MTGCPGRSGHRRGALLPQVRLGIRDWEARGGRGCSGAGTVWAKACPEREAFGLVLHGLWASEGLKSL